MSSMESSTFAQTEDRCDNYAMISRLLREEVDKELLSELKDSPLPEPTESDIFNEGYGQIRGHLDAIQDMDAGKSELAQDYCHTFLGYGEGDPQAPEESKGWLAAYPYESIYVTGDRSIGGEHCSEVTALYAAAGFRPQRERIAADDHIACEMEFMAYLVSQERKAMDGAGEVPPAAWRERELDFLEQHLLNWAGRFQEKVHEFAETDFYKGLVTMALGWLEQDKEYLQKKESE